MRFEPRSLWLCGMPLLALAGCNGKLSDRAEQARQDANLQAIEDAEGKIECAPPGANEFAYVCAIDRVRSQDGLFLTLRHPDGGFQRLLVTTDGRGVIAADGAERAVVTPIAANRIEVTLGGARYRLPATVKPGGAKK
jgi:hypothetical protein